jgi:hypothetical protein
LGAGTGDRQQNQKKRSGNNGRCRNALALWRLSISATGFSNSRRFFQTMQEQNSGHLQLGRTVQTAV